MSRPREEREIRKEGTGRRVTFALPLTAFTPRTRPHPDSRAVASVGSMRDQRKTSTRIAIGYKTPDNERLTGTADPPPPRSKEKTRRVGASRVPTRSLRDGTQWFDKKKQISRQQLRRAAKANHKVSMARERATWLLSTDAEGYTHQLSHQRRRRAKKALATPAVKRTAQLSPPRPRRAPRHQKTTQFQRFANRQTESKWQLKKDEKAGTRCMQAEQKHSLEINTSTASIPSEHSAMTEASASTEPPPLVMEWPPSSSLTCSCPLLSSPVLRKKL